MNAVKLISKAAPAGAAFLLWAGAGLFAIELIVGSTTAKSASSAPSSAPSQAAPELALVAKALGAKNAAKSAPATTPIPVDSSLALAGIAFGEQGQGIALVSTKNAPALPYRQGSELSPGLRLESVLRDRIILSKDGTTSEIMAPRPPQSLPPLPIPTFIAGAPMPPPSMQASPISSVARVIAAPPVQPSPETLAPHEEPRH